MIWNSVYAHHTGALGAALAFGFLFLMAAMVLAFWRLLRGPTLADRVIALDLMVVEVVALTAIYSVATRESAFLDVGIGVALVGFLGTTAFARYLDAKYELGITLKD